jgi:TetR/AcrR family transcriptional regulator, cholesterol catabolism regulator
MSSTRRARKEEQKEERRQDIIDAAWLLFQETSYGAVTMAQVAERAGLAKGTLYLYFTTKEELFLAVIDQELGKWFDHVDTLLEPLDARGLDVERAWSGRARGDGEPWVDVAVRIASLLSESLVERDAMTRLLTILHGILEQNVSYEAALRFQLSLLSHCRCTGTLLERCLPFLASGEGIRVLIRMYSLVIGLRQVCDPAPITREIRSRPDMATFRIDFGEELKISIGLLLSGSQRAASGGVS